MMDLYRWADAAHTAITIAYDDGRVATVPEGTALFWQLTEAEDAPEIAAFEEPQVSAVPQAVSNAQARAALRAAGLLASVETALDTLGDPAARDAWEYSAEFRRDSQLLQTLAAALGLTSQQIDALFVSAAQIIF